ncbi:acyl-CoA dehydrogenase family protein [Streptomyces sp. Li-HN-5-11]|uniref:acyl-CoA dehydrogenase family protein n=1 Tax=Streptomyces sp. Li-HN-5-11 TaxID=3075432 RepID=UPI0028ABE3A1|nr:acyl-CoA dehydrogenase family protein [Streptomyces sp. Li-HN-5-11]WNM31913.1 acyl-CoA dehydrogenase family protein [Streptomyces sp. Li-HN-5-11]
MKVDDFRRALRAWLDTHELSPGSDRGLDAQVSQLARVRGALWDAGWMRYGWPREVGGLGGPSVLRAVLGEEVASRDLAEPGIWSMAEVLVPTLIDYAPPALAAEMVPRLLGGREQWCQGFSEPGSGSDLASLSTRAVRDGETWVVSGQKVWTSLAQYAARCVLLARTDGPGHAGISAFFVDMDTPGITVRPLRTMHGVDEFAEVFLDAVRVPADRLLGAPGEGWRLAMDLLPYERSTCFWHRIAHLHSRLDRLLADGCEPDADALGAAWLGLHTVRCRSAATQRALAEGRRPGAETSVDKILLATAEQRLFDTARDLLPGAVELTGQGDWRTEYLYSRAATIYGGTAEIQRNIVARRLLDLGKE